MDYDIPLWFTICSKRNPGFSWFRPVEPGKHMLKRSFVCCAFVVYFCKRIGSDTILFCLIEPGVGYLED
jgi:hypothetical protein